MIQVNGPTSGGGIIAHFFTFFAKWPKIYGTSLVEIALKAGRNILNQK